MIDFAANDLKLSGSALAGLMHSVLDREADFRFEAKGFSMSPFIRHLDIVTVSRSRDRKAATGEVAAVVDPSTGRLFVHRVVGMTGAGAKIKGDNCESADGIFADTSILGIVSRVERRGKRVWFGGGPEKRLVAFLSRTRLLNTAILPLLRRIKQTFR